MTKLGVIKRIALIHSWFGGFQQNVCPSSQICCSKFLWEIRFRPASLRLVSTSSSSPPRYTAPSSNLSVTLLLLLLLSVLPSGLHFHHSPLVLAPPLSPLERVQSPPLKVIFTRATRRPNEFSGGRDFTCPGLAGTPMPLTPVPCPSAPVAATPGFGVTC